MCVWGLRGGSLVDSKGNYNSPILHRSKGFKGLLPTHWIPMASVHLCVLVRGCCCCCSVPELCPTICDPMDCSTPGCPVFHHLPEFAQTHVHWVGDAIQPSHPVVPFFSCPQSFPASGSFPMSRLFTSGGHSIGISTSVLPVSIQGWFPLGLTGLISLQPKGLWSWTMKKTERQRIDTFKLQQEDEQNWNTGKKRARRL